MTNQEQVSGEAVKDLGVKFRREIEIIEGPRVAFLLHGDMGVISFIFSTGWEVSAGRYGVAPRTRDGDLYPTAFGVDYHAKFKTECGYHRESCDWMDGHECWSDGSGLAGEDMLRKLIEEGSDAVWTELEGFYKTWLEDEAPDTATRATDEQGNATGTHGAKPSKPNPAATQSTPKGSAE